MLASREHANLAYQLSKKKQAYVKLQATSLCGVSKTRLDPKRVMVYPNGEVVHKHVASESEPH